MTVGMTEMLDGVELDGAGKASVTVCNSGDLGSTLDDAQFANNTNTTIKLRVSEILFRAVISHLNPIALRKDGIPVG